MPTQTLPNEILLRIIHHLREPRSPPYLGFRQGFENFGYQPDLATMMRVSKSMNKLTANVLYREVVVTDLSLLLEGVNIEIGSKRIKEFDVSEREGPAFTEVELKGSGGSTIENDQDTRTLAGSFDPLALNLAGSDHSANRPSKRELLRKIKRLHVIEAPTLDSEIEIESLPVRVFGASLEEWVAQIWPTQSHRRTQEVLEEGHMVLGDLISDIDTLAIVTLQMTELMDEIVLVFRDMLNRGVYPDWGSRYPMYSLDRTNTSWIDECTRHFVEDLYSFDRGFIEPSRSFSPSSVCKTVYGFNPWWRPRDANSSAPQTNTIHIEGCVSTSLGSPLEDTERWWSEMLRPGALNIIHSEYKPDNWWSRIIERFFRDNPPRDADNTRIYFYMIDDFEDPSEWCCAEELRWARIYDDKAEEPDRRIRFFAAETRDLCPACGFDYADDHSKHSRRFR